MSAVAVSETVVRDTQLRDSIASPASRQVPRQWISRRSRLLFAEPSVYLVGDVRAELGHVVVGPDPETDKHVGLIVARGEHD